MEETTYVSQENFENNLNQFIDHTLLKVDSSIKSVEDLCTEALENSFFSVCIAPFHINFAKRILRGSQVKICTVIGFPNGYSTADSKNFETRNALEAGATEIDMVMNVSALKSQRFDHIFQEIEDIKNICGSTTLKVILETSLLSDTEKVLASAVAKAAGADFIKTSTGFSGGGATVEDIKLMRTIMGPALGVKASGGIRDKLSAIAMIEAGANRLGCSAGINIIKGTSVETGDY
ncbi:MAG: deoxyribose-phosphate aldolase [Bdellovibrionales bacterium]